MNPSMFRELPEWAVEIRPAQLVAVEQIMDAYARGKRVVVLEAPTGCLAAGTTVIVNRAGLGRPFPIEDIVTKFNGGNTWGGRGNGRPVRWDLSIPTYVQTAVDGMARLGLLKSAWESGVQEVWDLTTHGGRTIRATATHPFSTPHDGYVPLGSLRANQTLLVRGTQADNPPKKPKAQYLYRAGLIHHPNATGANIKRPDCRHRVPLHRLVVEADLNEMDLESFIRLLRHEGSEGLAFLSRNSHVHHLDRNHRNNELSNLEVHEDGASHMREHGEFTNHVLYKIVTDRIRSIRFVGEEPTYDLELHEEPHNFIADGFVVHNSGKSLIAEMVRMSLDNPTGIYTATTKSLQAQIQRDFDCAVLMGRRNYTPLTVSNSTSAGAGGQYDDAVTCEDCTAKRPSDGCLWCIVTEGCPYRVARDEARRHRLTVLNTAYLLAQVQGPEPTRITRERGVLVTDECDEMENMLVDRAGVEVGSWWQKTWGVDPLVKGAHVATVGGWARGAAELGNAWAKGLPKPPRPLEMERRIRSGRELARKLARVGEEYAMDQDAWVRDYDARDERKVMLKPVRVGGWGRELLWDRLDGGTKVLAMSATVLDGDAWCRDVGLAGVEGAEDWEWEMVTVASEFPVENRPVWVVPAVDMKRGEKGAAGDADRERRWMEMGRACRLTLGVDRYSGINTLVHTVSYALTDRIVSAIVTDPAKGRAYERGAVMAGTTEQGLKVWAYQGARDRERAIEGYVEQGGVLVASSLERGADFGGDVCRLMIVCKTPFPNLGDRRVAARARAGGRRDGDRWYATQTARSLVQMTGRGVRGRDDHAETVVLDRGFTRWWKDWNRLVPRYWAEAVEFVPAGMFLPGW